MVRVNTNFYSVYSSFSERVVAPKKISISGKHCKSKHRISPNQSAKGIYSYLAFLRITWYPIG